MCSLIKYRALPLNPEINRSRFCFNSTDAFSFMGINHLTHAKPAEHTLNRDNFTLLHPALIRKSVQEKRYVYLRNLWIMRISCGHHEYLHDILQSKEYATVFNLVSDVFSNR